MFSIESDISNNESVFEFSLYQPTTGSWINIGADGGIRFNSSKPVSLKNFYDSPGTGSEEFAFQMLDWMNENADTGEVIEDRFVDCTGNSLAFIGVYRFTRIIPQVVNIELDLNAPRYQHSPQIAKETT